MDGQQFLPVLQLASVRLWSCVMVIKGGRLFAEGGTELLYDEKLMDDAGVEAIQRL